MSAPLFAAASDAACAALTRLEPGAWGQPSWPAPIAAGFGLLVLDGLLLARVRLGDRQGVVEILSTGDLLRPWQREDDLASIPREHRYDVLERSRVAVLDIDFAQRVSGFPPIAAQIVARAIRRSRHFAINMAIVQQPHVEARRHMLLWHRADRWGTVRAGGALVPVRLTQTVLGERVAARRPTVSAAIGVLERDGQLTRMASGWLLHGAPPGEHAPG